MSNATRAQVTRRAKALGVTVAFHRDRDDVNHEITLEAPAGFVFVSTGTHGTVTSGDHEPMDALYASALDDLNSGLEPCTDHACDTCQEAE